MSAIENSHPKLDSVDLDPKEASPAEPKKKGMFGGLSTKLKGVKKPKALDKINTDALNTDKMKE